MSGLNAGYIRFYLRLAIRRAPVMLLFFLVCSGMGVLLAIRLPTTYETVARLIVQQQQIAEDLAASTVQINALEEIQLLHEQLLTRTNLLDIANIHRVFDDTAQMLPGDIVEAMRASTRISASGGRGQPVLISVSFSGRSPQIAANVVNDYVTRLLAESVRQRAGAAGETLDFFEQEVQRLSTELDLRSAAITNFQRENADALPDDQAFRLNRVTLLQERLAAAERELRGIEDTRARTIGIFEATGRLGPTPDTPRSPEERELTELERELSQALTTFSENAPQVQQLQRRIEALREQVSAQSGFGTGDGEATTNPETLLALQLAEFDARAEALETQRQQIQAELVHLEDAIARTPLNTIALQGLQRDYENIRSQYDGAVERLSQASIGERIEVSARGQRITLIEPAEVPNRPASPNRPLIAAAGVAMGLAMAVAFFMLMEVINSTVRLPLEINNRLGITPLAVLPYMESSKDRVWRRARRVASALVVIAGVPAGLWVIDTYYLPLDLLAERVLDRIGLG